MERECSKLASHFALEVQQIFGKTQAKFSDHVFLFFYWAKLLLRNMEGVEEKKVALRKTT